MLSPLAELSFPHLWLQGSPGAPGPGGSPGTPVSSESREPKPGSGPGFLARGRGCSWPERGRDPSWGAGRDLGTAAGPGSSRDSAADQLRGAGGAARGSLEQPPPQFSPAGSARSPGAQRTKGGCGDGDGDRMAAVATGTSPALGDTRGSPPSLTAPTGQGEPCELCPTVPEGMLGAIGIPGQPGPRGEPGAPGRDGVSVSVIIGVGAQR